MNIEQVFEQKSDYALTPEVAAIGRLLDQVSVHQSVVMFPSWSAGFNGRSRLNDLVFFGAIIHQFWITDKNKIIGFDDKAASRDKFEFNEIIDRVARIQLTKRQVEKCVDNFVRSDLLKASKIDDAEIVNLLKSKSPQRIKGITNSCFWCKGSTYSLQEHHYPVPRSKGGTEVIQICPNCHYEYHSLFQRKFYKLTDKAIGTVLGGLES